MSITLVVVTDGRDHIYETIPTALAYLHGPITRRVIYDDSGDAENRSRLHDAFPTFVITHHMDGRQGFGGAIRFLWQHLADRDDNEWCFWLEDDFAFTRDVDLEAMMSVLKRDPKLVQMALRRQPWNAEERAAGGIVEQHPADYVDMYDGKNSWLEHRRFFTTNPSLFRMSLCALGWPDVEHSEGHFTHSLLEEPDIRFGFWGERNSGEWVTHIGKERAGMGY